MAKAVLPDGSELEYSERGSGEPALFIHGAFLADPFRPILASPALAGRFRLITYARRGHMASASPEGEISLTQQAADAGALLSFLGIQKAHVVGHSFGGCIALQLALESPGCVHSLALLEPAMSVGESGPAYRAALQTNLRRYREVGAEASVGEFLRARWPEYDAEIEAVLPGGHAQAVRDAGAWYEHDLPGLLAWSFGEEEARRLRAPVLSVLGERSNALSPRFGETHATLLTWLAGSDGFVVPGATHLMTIDRPAPLAAALAAFFSRHPMVPDR